MADFWRRMSRDQNWSLPILIFPCDYKIPWHSGIALFVICFSLFYSDILNHVTWTKTDILLIFHFLQNIWPYSWSSSLLFFPHIWKFSFDCCWCFDMFYYPHLFHTPLFPYGSHLYVGAIWSENFCLKSIAKWMKGKKHFFL